MLRILKIPCSNLGAETGYPDMFSAILLRPQNKCCYSRPTLQYAMEK
jgi:hypothetical protein